VSDTVKTVQILLISLLLLLAGCADGDDTADGPTKAPVRDIPTLSIEATEYAFQNPRTVEAGPVQLEMANQGEEHHVLILAKVAAGTTVEEATNALQAPPGPSQGPPPFTPLFGIAGTDPGQQGNATLVLEPGAYIIFCPVPSADGTPHLAQGMVSSFEVTGDAGGELPEADTSVQAQEFEFVDVPDLGPGENSISFTNSGEQEHEINLIELLPGTAIEDVLDFYRTPPGEGGPPPIVAHGGVIAQPGLTATTRFTLEPGKQYAFVCAVPDFTERPPVPHLLKGMYTEPFTVEG
jgi:hypothetical protein